MTIEWYLIFKQPIALLIICISTSFITDVQPVGTKEKVARPSAKAQCNRRLNKNYGYDNGSSLFGTVSPSLQEESAMMTLIDIGDDEAIVQPYSQLESNLVVNPP